MAKREIARAKQQVEWCCQDIEWLKSQIATFNKIIRRHRDKRHGGKQTFFTGCEMCDLQRDILASYEEDIIKAKKKIRGIIKGEA